MATATAAGTHRSMSEDMHSLSHSYSPMYRTSTKSSVVYEALTMGGKLIMNQKLNKNREASSEQKHVKSNIRNSGNYMHYGTKMVQVTLSRSVI